MPESRKRKKAVYTPPPELARTPKKKGPSPRWLAPLMLTLFLVGVVWLVVFYLSQGDMFGMPVAGEWENWNLLAGFGFIIAGFVLSTQWR